MTLLSGRIIYFWGLSVLKHNTWFLRAKLFSVVLLVAKLHWRSGHSSNPLLHWAVLLTAGWMEAIYLSRSVFFKENSIKHISDIYIYIHTHGTRYRRRIHMHCFISVAHLHMCMLPRALVILYFCHFYTFPNVLCLVISSTKNSCMCKHAWS